MSETTEKSATTPTSVADLQKGQIWREDRMNDNWARELVAVVVDGPHTFVRWRRPNGSRVVSCVAHRFLDWIRVTKAKCR